ncbi:MAG TPA: tetratricopeptide repeat protein [Terriglobia bacterium]
MILAVALLTTAAPLRAQQGGGNVTVAPNEQLFTVLAAMNAAGYDTGLNSEPSSSPRLEARAWCSEHKTEVFTALQKFYAVHAYADSAANLGQFVSLALMMGPPPNFKLTVADTDLPPDAQGIKELVPLLQRFYREADLQQLWTHLQPAYDQAVGDLSDPMRRSIAATDAYLRFASGAYLGRTYSISVSLLGAPDQVQARIYGANYYVVITRSSRPRIADLRHQYLHFLLDPLALKYALEIHQKAPLAALARPAPALGTDFKEDFSLLLTECLIRAVELRMDKPANAADQINQLTKDGLILVPHFYEALGDYAKQDASMNVYYRQMVLGIVLQKERQRLAKVQFSPVAAMPEPVSHPAPPPSAEEAQLDQGDNLIFDAKYAEAKVVFENVLGTSPQSERALFGLAVVASNTRKPDTAEEYFARTLAVARSLRIASWSHIYLGRLYDLEGHRKEALTQYQAAAVTAGAFPDALRAVQAGLAQPFGSKPESRP